MLQSLFRPVLRPIMMGVMSVTGSRRAWTPSALWPTGTEPGMWISPRTLASQWQDYTGTTPVATPGTVADSSNPVGLALDIRAGATVLTDPGNHMLQSTSAARPLASARVNLLTYTEDFSSFGWRNFNSGMTITTGQTDPDGGTTAVLLKPTADLNWHGFDVLGYFSNIGDNTFRVYIKPNGLQYFFMVSGSSQVQDIGTLGACFDLTGAGSVVRVGSWNASATVELHSSGYYICTINSIMGSGGMAYGASNSTTWGEFTGDGISGFYFAFPDLRVTGSADTLPLYQSVPGNGSTYASGPPIAQLYDGVDDGMATAEFSAGTLTSGMDCMIAVRRDSAAGSYIAGLFGDPSIGGNNFFGVAEDTNTNAACNQCGSPTVWVDNTQLAGGTSVTRATLYTALTQGDVHILEFRDLDLSAWTALVFGMYPGYRFTGARGDIMLYPSTTSTEDKDAARQWLADYYGVTLP